MRLELAYPVTPFKLFQPFGKNEACVKDFGKPTQVVKGKVNGACPVGFEELYPKFGMRAHNGNDLVAGEQTVFASHDGVVVEAQKVPARGLGIGLMTHTPVELDESGTHYAKTRYWHLKQLFVDVGDTIKKGQPLGISDNTGYSSGNHLHFELQPMDKDAGGHPYLAFNANGIGAAIDPEPFYTGELPNQTMITSLQLQLIVLLKKLVEALKTKKQINYV